MSDEDNEGILSDEVLEKLFGNNGLNGFYDYFNESYEEESFGMEGSLDELDLRPRNNLKKYSELLHPQMKWRCYSPLIINEKYMNYIIAENEYKRFNLSDCKRLLKSNEITSIKNEAKNNKKICAPIIFNANIANQFDKEEYDEIYKFQMKLIAPYRDKENIQMLYRRSCLPLFSNTVRLVYSIFYNKSKNDVLVYIPFIYSHTDEKKTKQFLSKREQIAIYSCIQSYYKSNCGGYKYVEI